MASTLDIQYRTESDGIAILTFDMPESRANILTRPVWDDLRSALKALRIRPGVTGLVLASAKPGIFIAGADLKFLGSIDRPDHPAIRELMPYGLSVLEMLETLPFPTCAAIDGAALGGGLEVALACDFRVAGSNPKVELGLPELRLGLIPGWGGTQRIIRLVPGEVALAMMLRSKSLSGAEAASAGLVEQSGCDDPIAAAIEVLKTSDRTPKRLAKAEPLPLVERELLDELLRNQSGEASEAARELLSVFSRGAAQPLADALPFETAAFCRLAGSDRSRALIAEFFASRKKA